MLSEVSFSASDHVILIDYLLSIFNKTTANIVAVIGDDVEVNKAIEIIFNVDLIGCKSHKFNLVEFGRESGRGRGM